jgi:hypothetical protein
MELFKTKTHTPLFRLHETKDYTEFSYYSYNRKIDNKKVARLKKSILETGQVISPIIVDYKGRIIDGQHRFQALKELGLPIFYLVRKLNGKLFKYLIESNNVLDKWKQFDFAKLYAESGIKNYEDIINVYRYWEKKLNRTLPFGRIVYAYTSCEGARFKNGTAVFLKNNGDKIFNILFELDKLYEDKLAFHFNNMRSLKKLLAVNKHFDSEHFIQQCKKKKFNTYSTVEDTRDSMIAVYNYHIIKASKKIRIV